MAQVIFAVDSGRRAGARLRFAAAVGLMLALSGCVPHPIYRSSSTAHSVPSHPVARQASANSVAPAAAPVRPVEPHSISTRDAYQVGMASYYGKKFHKRKTASGETFNMYKLTAAHRVLPLGTIVKVTHMSNGQSVVVKVNDRGPFIEGRILDLSFAAALELEMVTAGTAEVMIEIVDEAD